MWSVKIQIEPRDTASRDCCFSHAAVMQTNKETHEKGCVTENT